MPNTLQQNGLYDAYRVPGFITRKTAHGISGDQKAVVLKLIRRQKKQSAEHVELCTTNFTTEKHVSSAICPVETGGYTLKWRFAVYAVPTVKR